VSQYFIVLYNSECTGQGAASQSECTGQGAASQSECTGQGAASQSECFTTMPPRQ